MALDPRRHLDRFDTKLAKRADRQKSADEVWAEVGDEQKRRDETTVRLKAARLAREAEAPVAPNQPEHEKPREP
ncbi:MULTISPECIES: hypothetical protein [Methylobacterium]|uniref:Uncharacterized protein n=1 Tax=Methylobacterium thuringiense TaxID=1003091 RepID=A0ABQ4TLB6_9HYPH|nr:MULTISPECIES: hypothetical protein [Methylobacterium]TXN21784.1 hypothetical protein FV217_13320 [Methylobacterium sp. WL9]GJE54810.1 hypothetical protein EKPJFOCH_1295 [Methylobacterium thuringiense]